MSYQVLARKWRPRNFSQVVGQEAVVSALRNALERGRLHHAYLFTGTRGVGKTSLARILARCFNCETGVTAEPCGECGNCRAVDAGRFPDLLEVDAASRTRVEDTRELLDKVAYAPSQGRFRIYLIDEVHMLSDHSFNALLKTLEEPPEHVRFLLATTEPRKLPATVLSRCLQFHLRHLELGEIAAQLARVVAAEEEPLEAEPEALAALAEAADGSMRDALSLCDQAIAHGGGRLALGRLREMLGTVGQDRVPALLEALLAGDGQALLAEVAQLAAFCPDYRGLLVELMELLHRIAVEQAVPGSGDARIADWAQRLDPETLQLCYQAGVIGRRDFDLAPDARSALEMSLLRMLSFRLAPDDDAPAAATTPAAGTGAAPPAPAPASDAPAAEATAAPQPSPPPAPSGSSAAPAVELTSAPASALAPAAEAHRRPTAIPTPRAVRQQRSARCRVDLCARSRRWRVCHRRDSHRPTDGRLAGVVRSVGPQRPPRYGGRALRAARRRSRRARMVSVHRRGGQRAVGERSRRCAGAAYQHPSGHGATSAHRAGRRRHGAAADPGTASGALVAGLLCARPRSAWRPTPPCWNCSGASMPSCCPSRCARCPRSRDDAVQPLAGRAARCAAPSARHRAARCPAPRPALVATRPRGRSAIGELSATRDGGGRPL